MHLILVRGRGIPAPIDHPKQLVVTGLYQYVRNPMYLGVFTVMADEVLLFKSVDLLIFTAGWFVFVHLNVILYEERTLQRKFGESYTRYFGRVRRWIPGRKWPPEKSCRAPGFKSLRWRACSNPLGSKAANSCANDTLTQRR